MRVLRDDFVYEVIENFGVPYGNRTRGPLWIRKQLRDRE